MTDQAKKAMLTQEQLDYLQERFKVANKIAALPNGCTYLEMVLYKMFFEDYGHIKAHIIESEQDEAIYQRYDKYLGFVNVFQAMLPMQQQQ